MCWILRFCFINPFLSHSMDAGSLLNIDKFLALMKSQNFVLIKIAPYKYIFLNQNMSSQRF